MRRASSFGPPRLISPSAAVKTYTQRNAATRAFLPTNLSDVSERIVALWLERASLRAAAGTKVPEPGS